MRGWMLAGIRRNPGPLIGTMVASATAAALTVAAISVAGAHTPAPAGRLAGASVVVAGDTNLTVTVGSGPKAATGAWVLSIPLAPAAVLVAAVAALIAGAVMIPFGAMSRREPAFASGWPLTRHASTDHAEVR